MTDLPLPLDQAVRSQPDHPALVTPAQVYTYADLHRLTDAFAAHLIARLPNDPAPRRIALMLDPADTVVACVLLWASLRLGLCAVPIDCRLPTRMVRPILQDNDIFPVYFNTPESDQPVPGVSWSESLSTPSSPNLRGESIARPAEHEATGLLTSGSTGDPKLCVHSLGNHVYNALGSNQNILLRPGDRWLLSLPLNHVGGLAILFRAALAGAAVAVAGPEDELIDSIANLRITHCSMVPTQLHRYLHAGGRRETLSALLVSGASTPPALIAAAVDRGLPLRTSYGLTEMASQVTTTEPGAPLTRLFTSGRLLPHRELQLDPAGEVLVRGETLCLGYLERGTVMPVTGSDGWYHTGDTGILDPDGYLKVTGRRDNMFISGGENIQPELIERVLIEFPGISEAVVVAAPDDEFGARPFAFVAFDERDPRDFDQSTRLIRDYIMLTGAMADTPIQVKTLLKDRLPRHAIPVRFAIIPPAARQGIKVSRAVLTSLARQYYRPEKSES